MTVVERHPQAGASLSKRLWLYQAERFPLAKTSILLAVFSAASISVSAQLGGRPLPPLTTFAAVWFVTIIIFFQMRACDEWKDLEDDRRFRPERPIPSGLVSLELILSLAALCALVAVALTAFVSGNLVLALLLVWVWLGLMTFEFFAPAWLKKRPLLYLVSHMAIMPLIDLFVTAAEWLPVGLSPPPGLWLFLLLSFVNGCVLEIGRKVWAPESERHGVETYSGLLGPERAVGAWLALCGFAWMLLAGVGYYVGAPLSVAIPGLIALGAAAWVARSFAVNPTAAIQKRVDTAAGLWVFVCYCLAGFAPLLAKWIAA
jgi:4-hydroxybenzoate polyprenyltransferase